MKLFRKLFGLTWSLLPPALCVCGGIIFELPTDHVVLAASRDGEQTVVLDAGHGGPDPGAVRGRFYEKDINLQIARAVAQLLAKEGIKVSLTREDDNDLAGLDDEKRRRRHQADLQARIRLIRSAGPDAVVSIHCNWSANPSAQGVIVLFRRKGHEGERLAKGIIESLHKSGIKADSSLSSRSLYLLRHTQAPYVLIEVGFLSNQTEAKQLISHEYQSKLAHAIECGVLIFLNEDNRSSLP